VLPGRGATLNFVEYEAENMTTNGQQLGPTTTFGQVASEASGRRAVRLAQTGQSVQFTNATDANAIVVRYSIPDGGENYWATLSVYVNGTLSTHLSLTSRYSWSYGPPTDFNTPAQKDPSQGNAHHFFDEARAMLGDVPAGATVMIRKDGGDTAGYYDVDLVDMESVGPPLGQPAGYLSLTADCGVALNYGGDQSAAIQNCVNMAQGQGRGLYIPPGSFNSFSSTISVAGLTIRGAGMWYSQIYGYNAHFDCWGNNCQYYDFAVTGDSTIRIDTNTDTAFGGNGSTGVVLKDIWIEHTKTGYWTGPGTNNLTIEDCRIRDTWADGVNLYGGTSNCTVTNNHLRNTGDDSIAAWSDTAPNDGPDHGNVISFNYVQLPWMAQCFALYGGDSNSVQDNVCADVVQSPGILMEQDFNALTFTGNTQVQRNTLLRAGAWMFNQPQAAVKFNSDQTTIQNVTIGDIDIVDAAYYAFEVQGNNPITNITINGATVTNPGSGTFLLMGGANGWMNVSNVVATGSPLGVQDGTNGAFQVVRGGGNSGW
jgi:parallel beta-helix repeat protein